MCSILADTFRRVRLCAAFAAPAVCALLQTFPAEAADLPVGAGDPEEGLPYRFVVEDRFYGPSIFGGGLDPSLDLADLDGDALDEIIVAYKPGIEALRHAEGRNYDLWQHNIPPSHSWRLPCAMVCGAFDLDGSGSPTVVAMIRREDGSDWRIRALAAEDGRLIDEVALPEGMDHRRDGIRGVNYKVLGMFDVPTPDGPRRAYAVVAGTGYDLEPRGALAVATGTGEVLWRFEAGPVPRISNAKLIDLDGDGGSDILYVGFAVGNLGGRKIGGYGDDVARVIAVRGGDGTMLWTHALFEGSCGGHLDVADLDRDGRLDVVVGSHHAAATGNVVRILDAAEGFLRAEIPVMGGVTGVGADTTSGLTPRALVSTTVGISSFEFDGTDMTLAASAPTEGNLVLGLVDDLLPRPGAEAVVCSDLGRCLLLDRNLDVLAFRSDADLTRISSSVKRRRLADGIPRILCLTRSDQSASLQMRIEPVPAAVRPWWMLAAIPVFGAAMALVRRLRRRRLSSAGIRETRLHLLSRLELSNHGAIGALKSLRRLVWLLEAFLHGGGEPLRARIESLAREILDISLPDLTGVLETVTAEIAPWQRVVQAKEALALIRVRVDQAAGDGVSDESAVFLLADLKVAVADAERALQEIRAAVGCHFQADLPGALNRVLANLASELRAHGVAVAHSESCDEAPLCRIDPGELGFLLENLVANSIRAMEGSSERRIDFDCEAEGGMVAIEVNDSGCGIPHDDWERILETRYSTAGGGMGLPRSREILRKYDGRIFVKDSSPGRGTTMRVEVPAAGTGDRRLGRKEADG